MFDENVTRNHGFNLIQTNDRQFPGGRWIKFFWYNWICDQM